MAATTEHERELDAWAHTALGDPASWSAPLRVAAQICLAYPTPCCLLWGERSRFFYNSAMAESIAARHPSGMGQPLYDVLPAMWRTVGPIVHEVMRTARPFTATRFPIQADIGEGVAQFFVDYTFVPVLDGDRVVGVFAPVGNNTQAHLDSQHHVAVAAAATVPPALTGADAAAQILRHLVVPDDVRFAVLFLRDPGTGALVRAATAGGPLRPASTLAALDVAVARGVWPLEDILAARSGPQRIEGPPRSTRVSRPLWEDAWLTALPGDLDGVLVLGLDPRFVLPAGPADLVARLAAVTADRLGR